MRGGWTRRRREAVELGRDSGESREIAGEKVGIERERGIKRKRGEVLVCHSSEMC